MTTQDRPHRIAIAGASGRMGQMLIDAVNASGDCLLTGALDVASSPAIGLDASAFSGRASGVLIHSDLREGLKDSRVLIDFTRPEATLVHLEHCQSQGVSLIIGTTGFNAAEKQAIENAAQKISVVFAPNMAVGVNAVFKLLSVAAKILNAGYDVEVIEAHHRHKVDAPSGTALRMGEVVANALGQDLSECAIYGRQGHTGERPATQIGFSTIRGGDIVGDHTVLFAGEGERIEITHKSASRMSYALGALRAGRFLADKSHGLFDMQDVLGLK